MALVLLETHSHNYVVSRHASYVVCSMAGLTACARMPPDRGRTGTACRRARPTRPPRSCASLLQQCADRLSVCVYIYKCWCSSTWRLGRTLPGRRFSGKVKSTNRFKKKKIPILAQSKNIQWWYSTVQLHLSLSRYIRLSVQCLTPL